MTCLCEMSFKSINIWRVNFKDPRIMGQSSAFGYDQLIKARKSTEECERYVSECNMGRPNCWRLSVLSYVILFCVTGVGQLVSITYILLRRFSLRFFVSPLRLSLYWSYTAPLLVAATTAVGWSGVCKRNKVILRLFSMLMSVVVLLEAAFCIWSFAEKEDLGQSVTNLLTANFPTKENRLNTSAEWDIIQTQLKCCGIHESGDYVGTNIPKSCSEITTQGKVVHLKGCLYPLMELLTDDFNVASIILLSIALIQVPGVFLSWCLSNRIVELGIARK